MDSTATTVVSIIKSTLGIMEVASGVPAFLRDFTDIMDQLPKVLNSFSTLCQSFASTVDGILKDFNAMKKARIKLESKTRTVYHDLLAASESGLLFVENVNNLLWFGRDEAMIREVEEGIDSNDFQPLSGYISQLQFYLYQVGVTYQLFTDSCKQASKSAVEAAETCKYNAEQQRSRRKATQVVGGVATGAILGVGGGVATVGIVASAAIGPFTGGIGTVVGLAITVGATTGLAVTSAAVTHMIAKGFKKLEKEFRALANVFDSFANHSESMNEDVETLHLRVTLISSCLDSVEHSWKKVETTVCVKAALSLLRKRFEELYQRSCSCSETINLKQQELKACFETFVF